MSQAHAGHIQAGLMTKLLIERGDPLGRELELSKNGHSVVIGRGSACDLGLTDTRCSRRHAEVCFSPEDKAWRVRDMESSNGTKVNGEALQPGQWRLLSPCDRIVIGETEVVFDPSGASHVHVVEEPTDTVYVAPMPVGEEGTLIGFRPKDLDAAQATTLDPLTRLQVVYHYADIMRQCHDLREVVEHTLDALFQVVHAERGAVLLRREDCDALEPVASRTREANGQHNGGKKGTTRALAISNSIIRRCQEERRPMIVVDAAADTRFKACDTLQRDRIGSALCLPLVSGDELFGVLYLDTRAGATPFSAPEVDLATGICNQAALAIGNTLHHREEVHRREEQAQLDVARRIHEKLLSHNQLRVPGLMAYGANRPSSLVGGDYFGLLRTRRGPLLAIADSTGHGIGSAMLMTTARAYLMGLLEGDAPQGDVRVTPPLTEILERLNRLLMPDLDRGLFVTCLLARLEPRGATGHWRLHYVSAGHEPPIIYRPREDRFLPCETGGIALGMVEGFAYQEGPTVDLEPDDLLCLFTDGIVEQPNAKGKEWRLEGLREALRKAAREKTPEASVAQMLTAVDVWRGAGTPHAVEQKDDLSLVIARTVGMENAPNAEMIFDTVRNPKQGRIVQGN